MATGLSLRKPVGLSRVRANGALPEFVSMFLKLCEIAEECKWDVAKDIYNLDETFLDMTGGKVKFITPTTKKNVSKLSGPYGEKGEHVTLLATIFSDRSSLMTLFIFSAKHTQ